MAKELVELDVVYHHETNAAWKVSFENGAPTWVPKSQVKELEWQGALREGQTKGTFWVTEWYAKEHDLI